jgi:hypothetical protein
MKERYKFSHRSDDGTTLYWVAVAPIDERESRHASASCGYRWFWSTAGMVVR